MSPAVVVRDVGPPALVRVPVMLRARLSARLKPDPALKGPRAATALPAPVRLAAPTDDPARLAAVMAPLVWVTAAAEVRVRAWPAALRAPPMTMSPAVVVRDVGPPALVRAPVIFRAPPAVMVTPLAPETCPTVRAPAAFRDTA